jgi:thiol-disulfide isomerase/thioredoxin
MVSCVVALASIALAQTQPPSDKPLMGMGAPKPKPAAAAPAPAGPIGPAQTTLQLDTRRFDFEGTRLFNRMYVPIAVLLADAKPPQITNEPAYKGKARYGVIPLGNASPELFAFAIDQLPDGQAEIHLDLNGDGDLTNDQTGTWQTIEKTEDGAFATKGTWDFLVGYAHADGSRSESPYALNLYWQTGRDQVNYYAASALTGTIEIGGKTYDVELTEVNADGNFSKLHNPDQPAVFGETLTKPVWLSLDGSTYDIRGTFQFGGVNYLATVSPDGRNLRLDPSFRVIELPRPQVLPPTLLAVGADAPDFTATRFALNADGFTPAGDFKLSDHRGKIVVLDFWASWCGPCIKGLPHLSKLTESLKGQNVVVIAMNTSDEEEAFLRFVNGRGKDYAFSYVRDPAGRDPQGKTISKELFGVSGIPTTFVINPEGKIAGVVSGYREGDQALENILTSLGLQLGH